MCCRQAQEHSNECELDGSNVCEAQLEREPKTNVLRIFEQKRVNELGIHNNQLYKRFDNELLAFELVQASSVCVDVERSKLELEHHSKLVLELGCNRTELMPTMEPKLQRTKLEKIET